MVWKAVSANFSVNVALALRPAVHRVLANTFQKKDSSYFQSLQIEEDQTKLHNVHIATMPGACPSTSKLQRLFLANHSFLCSL